MMNTNKNDKNYVLEAFESYWFFVKPVGNILIYAQYKYNKTVKDICKCKGEGLG